MNYDSGKHMKEIEELDYEREEDRYGQNRTENMFDERQEVSYPSRKNYQQRGGEHRLHMKFARAAVSSYENHVILENGCPAFIEMYTVKNGTDLDIYYKMTGYTNFSAFFKNRMLSDIDVLRLTLEALNLIRSCEDYLIFSEYISFRADRMYVSSEDQSLRFMYLPGYRTTRPLKTLIAGFVDDVEALRNDGSQTQGLLEEYKREVLLNEYGIRGYINLAEDLIRTKIRDSGEYGEHHNISYDPVKEKTGIEVRDSESEYFAEKVGGLIGVKKKIINFMDQLLS